MEYKIALIPGDGIGPEIVREAKKFWMPSVPNSVIHLVIQKSFLEEPLLMYTVFRLRRMLLIQRKGRMRC